MECFPIHTLLNIEHIRAVRMSDIRDVEIPAISTDTRTLRNGDVYLALKGETHNGHDYVQKAVAGGALACIVEQGWYRKHGKEVTDCPLLVVKNTVQAYGAIANLYRKQFDIPVIGITGSNGKTTTKELVSAVLRTKYCVLSTTGNYNNHIGAPKTLLELTSAHQIAVVEMGTNQPGDIEYLCDIVEPTHAIITNIGAAHLERLLSKDIVAKEKMTLFRYIKNDGIRYVNNDDEYTSRFVSDAGTQIRFGYTESSDVRILDCKVNSQGLPKIKFFSPAVSKKEFSLTMQTVGVTGAYAAAIGLAVGMSFDCAVYKMKEAIQKFESPDKRLKVHRINGITIIDDSYNANPDSMKAAIDTIAAMKSVGSRFVVLGDMLELGQESKSLHRMIGEYLNTCPEIDYVFTYGKYSREISAAVKGNKSYAEHFSSKEKLAEALMVFLDVDDVVVVKGSRGIDMTPVVNEMLRKYGETDS